MDLIELLAQELGQTVRFVENVVRLLDEGNTIPFIARYRKEQHGGMDDTTLRTLEERLTYLRNLDKRRQEVKSAIENQGKLTEALVSAIDAAATLTEVEDLYRPCWAHPGYCGPGKRDWNRWRRCCLPRSAPAPTWQAAQAYLNPEKGVETVADALQGANDIIAEQISDDAAIRKTLRELIVKRGVWYPGRQWKRIPLTGSTMLLNSLCRGCRAIRYWRSTGVSGKGS